MQLWLAAITAALLVGRPASLSPPFARRVVPAISCDRQPGQLGGRVPPRPSSEQDEEYEAALLDAQRASARLQALDAERRLREVGGRQPTAPPLRPRGARTSISRSDAGTLLVEVPAAGLNAGTLMGGAFSAAWFSAVVPATFASGGAGVLFMLPFWLAGGVVAKQTVVDPAKATSLSIGEFAWEIKQQAVGLPLSSESGPTEELDGASVEVAAYVNGMPSYQLRLFSGTQAWSVGDGLPAAELEWVAAEVNAHLETLRRAS